MMRSAVAITALLAIPSCAATLGEPDLRIFNRTLLVVSTASLACDMGQTIPVAMSTPRDQPFEANWILGDHPSVGALIGYTSAAIGINGALYATLPERRRWLVPLIVSVVQAGVIAGNAMLPPEHATTRPWCGLR